MSKASKKQTSPENEAEPEVTEHYVLPLRNLLVFPGQVMPLSVGRERSLLGVREAQDNGGKLLVLAQKDPSVEDPNAEALYDVGCEVEILKSLRVPDGSMTVIVQGVNRFHVDEIIDEDDKPLRARGVIMPEEEMESVEIDALNNNLQVSFSELADHVSHLTDEHLVMAHNAESPGALADLIGATLPVDLEQKQALLKTSNMQERLVETHKMLVHELEVQKLSSKIQDQVQGEITRGQREFYLRQQMEAIRDELGEGSDDSDLTELGLKIEDANLPEATHEAAKKELKRLGRMNSSSPDWSVTRTWIDWILDLPWNTTSEDVIDLETSKDVLDRDHHGLEKVKNRILEFLAVRHLKQDMRGPILCFAGPPGVGKTSLGKSIAESLGRKFIRLSLGGVRDEAEIRGHRRTYVGALPGRIIQAIKKAGTNNPVFMLDEIDKLGAGHAGDPGAALLEVLDPEQNSTFSDHYLEQEFDLSKVMFIATANWIAKIPGPLRDRMEIIHVPGYATHDKVKIAEKHLLPQLLEDHGLKKTQVAIGTPALRAIVEDYTREAGVRELGRRISTVLRVIARNIVEGAKKKQNVKLSDLATYLGKKKFSSEVADRLQLPGVATGLAWTPFGGQILFIEATRMPGKGRLMLTGQLGDVMRESAQAAMSIIKAEIKTLGLKPEYLDRSDIHIHFPAGAVPKDGPSAGVSILTALVSLLTGRSVRKNVAMTGEISLRGLVLPVGGINEKVLAAKRAGIGTVILPDANRVDVEEMTPDTKKGLKFHFVSDVQDVIGIAIGKRKTGRKRKPLLAEESN
ncbi:MAG: ATP-dependent Lon protease [Planctomycetota bacterium]|jgi:ATP-dependent Lon protease